MKRPPIVIGYLTVGICLLVVGLVVAIRVVHSPVVKEPYVPVPMNVYPESSSLQKTAIVPTIDSAMPEGKNVIWCASFQLAWAKLASDVLHSPPIIAHAEAVVDRLNRKAFSENDIADGSCYAAAGRSSDGIVKEICQEMQRRFQRVSAIDELGDPKNVIVAYSYMEAGIPFPIHYYENPLSLVFKDGRGKDTSVASFGAHFNRQSTDKRLREQVRVLHCTTAGMKTLEFVIDPCAQSSPNQVILASIPAERTLRATWNSVETRIAQYRTQPDADERFDRLDELLVPSMAWDITHHFSELEGTDKLVKNKGFEGLYLAHAIQGIRFRLDRSGVELRSEALVVMSGIPRRFVFDQPFFVFIRKRGSNVPFFAMYVANAELLCHQPTAPRIPSTAERKGDKSNYR
jgi:hypothetical protein